MRTRAQRTKDDPASTETKTSLATVAIAPKSSSQTSSSSQEQSVPRKITRSQSNLTAPQSGSAENGRYPSRSQRARLVWERISSNSLIVKATNLKPAFLKSLKPKAAEKSKVTGRRGRSNNTRFRDDANLPAPDLAPVPTITKTESSDSNEAKRKSIFDRTLPVNGHTSHHHVVNGHNEPVEEPDRAIDQPRTGVSAPSSPLTEVEDNALSRPISKEPIAHAQHNELNNAPEHEQEKEPSEVLLWPSDDDFCTGSESEAPSHVESTAEQLNPPNLKAPTPQAVINSNSTTNTASTPAVLDDEELSDSEFPPAYRTRWSTPDPEAELDAADQILRNEYKPMTDVQAFLKGLTKLPPSQRSTEVLYDLAQNAQIALVSWQNEYLALDRKYARLQNPPKKPATGGRDPIDPLLYEDQKEADLYGYTYDPKRYIQNPFAQRTTTSTGGRELRQRRSNHVADLGVSEDDAGADGGRRRTRRQTAKFTDTAGTGTATPYLATNPRKRGFVSETPDEDDAGAPAKKRGRAANTLTADGGSQYLNARIRDLRAESIGTQSAQATEAEDQEMEDMSNDDEPQLQGRRRGRPPGSKNLAKRSDAGIKKGPRPWSKNGLAAAAAANLPPTTTGNEEVLQAASAPPSPPPAPPAPPAQLPPPVAATYHAPIPLTAPPQSPYGIPPPFTAPTPMPIQMAPVMAAPSQYPMGMPAVTATPGPPPPPGYANSYLVHSQMGYPPYTGAPTPGTIPGPMPGMLPPVAIPRIPSAPLTRIPPTLAPAPPPAPPSGGMQAMQSTFSVGRTTFLEPQTPQTNYHVNTLNNPTDRRQRRQGTPKVGGGGPAAGGAANRAEGGVKKSRKTGVKSEKRSHSMTLWWAERKLRLAREAARRDAAGVGGGEIGEGGGPSAGGVAAAAEGGLAEGAGAAGVQQNGHAPAP